MSPQLILNYPAAYVGREAWERQLDVIRAAVKHLSAKEVAHVLDIGPTHLSDALNERDRKVWHGHWTHVLKAMLAAKPSDDTAADLLRALVEFDVATTPFAVSENVALTPEDEAAGYKRELLKFGDAGAAAIDRIKKRGRR